MNRTVRLIDTPRSVWFICSSPSLRALVLRNRARLLPKCNSVIQWRDVHGYGISLTVAN